MRLLVGGMFVLAVLLGVAPPARAVDAAGAPLTLAQAVRIGAARAAAIVRRATGGEVLSVAEQTVRGRAVYRVKVLLGGGRVRVLMVDAETGRMLR